jgi:2'-5' RNA ligase
MRTFIAIKLPQNIRTGLSNIQDELKQTGADVKWVKPDNIHLTLKFLGEIDDSLAEKIKSVISAAAQQTPSFNLSLSQLGAFPKIQFPRVIWIGVNNDQPVIKMAKDLEQELIKIGIPTESRAFNSHITLGRVRSAQNRRALSEKLETLNKPSSSQPEFTVSGITLFKSTLTPQGPIYEAISDSPLK